MLRIRSCCCRRLLTSFQSLQRLFLIRRRPKLIDNIGWQQAHLATHSTESLKNAVDIYHRQLGLFAVVS